MKKTISIVTSLLLVVVLLGFGCKGLSQDEKASVRPVTLNYWTVFNDVSELKKFAAQYKALRPYVTINIRQVRYNEFDDLFTNALADGVGPDIVSMHATWIPKYEQRLSRMPSTVEVARLYESGTITKELVVEKEVNQMPTRQIINNNYVQVVPNTIIRNNRTYGLPLAVDTLAIYYNQQLLDRAGIPEPPTNWDDFVSAVVETTRFNSAGNIVQSGVALGTGENIDNSFDILSLLMMQNGVRMKSGSSVAFSAGINNSDYSHPTLQALQFYTDFANPNKEAYSWNAKMSNAFDAFVRGQSAFYFGYGFDRDRILARSPGMKLKVIPVPQLSSGKPVNVANFWVESVVRDAEAQNEAWDFVRFMALPDNARAYSDATGQVSPFRSHVAEQAEEEDRAPFASQVLFAENWYNGTDVDVAEQAFNDMVENFLKPYVEGTAPITRDRQIIINAARLIQQTM